MKRGQSVKLILTDTVHGGLCLEMPSEHLIFFEQPWDIVITKPAVVWIIMFFCCLFEKWIIPRSFVGAHRVILSTWRSEFRIKNSNHEAARRLTISFRYLM